MIATYGTASLCLKVHCIGPCNAECSCFLHAGLVIPVTSDILIHSEGDAMLSQYTFQCWHKNLCFKMCLSFPSGHLYAVGSRRCDSGAGPRGVDAQVPGSISCSARLGSLASSTVSPSGEVQVLWPVCSALSYLTVSDFPVTQFKNFFKIFHLERLTR